MKNVTKKLKNKETKSSLLANSNTNSDNNKSINNSKLKRCVVVNEYKTIGVRSINKKMKNVKKTAEPLSSSLLMCNLDKKNENMDTDDDNIDNVILHEPEIFIDTKYNELSMKLKSESDSESISHKNPSLQEFLDIWDDTWSDKQILSYFTHYLSDPRVIALLNIEVIENVIIPKEIWQTIVSFEFGSTHSQIKRRYYHWISQQRKEIYWIPFILGSIQSFGVFFVFFYVFVSGTSLHDAADIGAADITNDENGNNSNDTIHTNDNENNIFDIRFYMALMTVIAAAIQIFGALRSYYLARFRYAHKLKRFKRIIHLQTHLKTKHKHKHKHMNDDIDDIDDINDIDESDESDDDDDDDDIDKETAKYETVRDLPNVEINFDINQVPQEFRHIFLMKDSEKNTNGLRYHDLDSDSEDEKDNNDNDNDNDNEDEDKDNDDDDDLDLDLDLDMDEFEIVRLRQKKRLNYMMGIIDEDNGDCDEVFIDDDSDYNLEEMQLILCGWESYISFQRWINLSSLVVTDNLHDPYLICFVLHKYFYVLCISTYVFGQQLTTWQSLIPFIILFLSFSYLGLIVLDRISAKRAILYVLSMIGCCGIIIGIFTGILFLLSYLFYTDSNNNPSQITNTNTFYNTTMSPNTYTPINNNTYALNTTQIVSDENGDEGTEQVNGEGEAEERQQQTWWITDFFYPILAFILCSNTIRRIRNGFENNIPEIKYTLWSNCCFVSLIMTFATNSATWSNAEVKAAFLLIFVYMGYLWAQMRLHQAVTRLKKIDYANKYLQNSGWVKKQLFWSWLGQLSNQF